MATGEVLDVTLRVVDVFERPQIDYLAGGSLASSLHGIPRATQDVDIGARLELSHVPSLVAALEDEFYVDADMIEEAIRKRSSFNVIHLATMFKVDVFVLKPDALAETEMERRQTYTLPGPPERELVVASPEDIILQKLHWYEIGRRISERQWRDVLGVLKVRGPELDCEYPERTAAQMGLSDLFPQPAPAPLAADRRVGRRG